MLELKTNRWYIRISDGKKLYCYDLSVAGHNFGYFSLNSSRRCEDILFSDQVAELNARLISLFSGANLSRLSTALGKHRSYLNKLIQVGCSDKTYNKVKDKLTIDWNSDKPLYVNDGMHVPFTIKPISCKQNKHKEWLQSLMMKGCVKL